MFPNCILARGYNRGLIMDIQRGTSQTVPDNLCEIVELFLEKKSIIEVEEIYGIKNKSIIQEYIDFLIKNEYAIIVDYNEFDLFINMNKSFDIPSHISNCIIEISAHTITYLRKTLIELDKVFCWNLQLVAYNELNLKTFLKVLKITNEYNFRSIEIILKYTNEINDFVKSISKVNFKITSLTFHSLKEKKEEEFVSAMNINYIDYEMKSFNNCGKVNMDFFAVNKDAILESLNYNSCLYKKISIDKHGNIKNCPSMAESFGNIKDIALDEALNKPNFKKYWNITKDQIKVCKDCEFRHICTDCRAYIEEPDNDYSKPLKCGYNPYTNVWEEWSTNPLKQKAIEFYGMQDLVKIDL